jgi:hypothetical protein
MRRAHPELIGIAVLAAALGLGACGIEGAGSAATYDDAVLAAALAADGAGKSDGNPLEMSLSDWYWCGTDGAGTTKKGLMLAAKNYYMTTDRLDRKLRFAVSPRHGNPVVALEASVYLRRCVAWTPPAEGEDFPSCTEYGKWSWEPVKLKVGHGSVELDLGCLAMGTGLSEVYKTKKGQTFFKLRTEQGFDGPTSLVAYELQSTCGWTPPASAEPDYCFAQPESADAIECDRQKVYEIEKRTSSFLLDQRISPAIYLATQAPWRETAAATVQIGARLRVLPCELSRPGEDFPVCLRYGQALWREIKPPVSGDSSVSLEMGSLAMGLGLDQVFGDGSSRFWIITYSVSEPGSYRVQTSCPF